ncbi:MAG: HAD family hydrolase, partial [bacterium]
MPPRAVLFDAVGTLIHLREPVGDTYARLSGGGDAQRLQAAFNRALRARPPMVFGDLPAAALAEAERGWWHELVREVFAAAGAPLADAAFERLWRHYAGAEAWRAAPGAEALLRRLRESDKRIGLVSNFDH